MLDDIFCLNYKNVDVSIIKISQLQKCWMISFLDLILTFRYYYN